MNRGVKIFTSAVLLVMIAAQTTATAVVFATKNPSPVVVSYYESSILQDEKININTAGYEQLKTLYGIGDVLARRIIEYREMIGGFTDVVQLLNIEGIGEAKLNRIKFNIKISD